MKSNIQLSQQDQQTQQKILSTLADMTAMVMNHDYDTAYKLAQALPKDLNHLANVVINMEPSNA